MDPTSFDPRRLLANGTAGQLSGTAVAPQPARPGDTVDPAYRAKATAAAVKFESFFIGHLLHQMRAGARALAAEDSPGHSRINDDMLDMADNLVADQMAGQRAFGVADAILRQLLPAPPAAALDVADSQKNTAPLNPRQ